jgi:hypothetical protein
MKVLLKQARTGNFLKGLNSWTANSTEALDFKTTPSAMDYSQNHGLGGMCIVLKFADARLDVELENCC